MTRYDMQKFLFSKIRIFLYAAIGCLIVVSGFLLLRPKAPIHIETPPYPPLISFDPARLKATAAIIYDPQSGRILYAKNDELQMPLASLTKLMTADTALETLGATSSVRISRAAIATEGDSGLKEGEVWNVGSLIRYALLVSSNDGMAAVAENAGGASFIKKMNSNAQSLGLVQSYFLDPTGLDMTSEISGGYGSARDVAVLAAQFYKNYPSFFESSIRQNQIYTVGKDVLSGRATAAPILDIPGLIGAKTGYTDLAGGNLVTIVDASLDHPLVIVVLHSTEKGRFEDVRSLVAAVRNQIM